MSESTGKKLTVFFNVGLTLALVYFSFLSFLFDKQYPEASPYNIAMLPFIHGHPGREIVFGCVAGLVGIALFMYIFKEVWNRIVVRLTGLREMKFREAYALTIFAACCVV